MINKLDGWLGVMNYCSLSPCLLVLDIYFKRLGGGVMGVFLL